VRQSSSVLKLHVHPLVAAYPGGTLPSILAFADIKGVVGRNRSGEKAAEESSRVPSVFGSGRSGVA